jgi:hypothetical protein
MHGWQHRSGTYVEGDDSPHYQRVFGDGRVATVTYDPVTGGNIAWHLHAPRPGRGLVRVGGGEAGGIDEAKGLAEEAYHDDVHKLGRRPSGEAALSSTDRNRLRMARLLETARAEADRTRKLAELHRDLVMGGQVEAAARLGQVVRSTAMRAVASYTRRNKSFFATNGRPLLSPPERAERERYIEALADRFDALAADAAAGVGHFESVLQDLHKVGFYPDGELVSAVAQGFCLTG